MRFKDHSNDFKCKFDSCQISTALFHLIKLALNPSLIIIYLLLFFGIFRFCCITNTFSFVRTSWLMEFVFYLHAIFKDDRITLLFKRALIKFIVIHQVLIMQALLVRARWWSEGENGRDVTRKPVRHGARTLGAMQSSQRSWFVKLLSKMTCISL